MKCYITDNTTTYFVPFLLISLSVNKKKSLNSDFSAFCEVNYVLFVIIFILDQDYILKITR